MRRADERTGRAWRRWCAATAVFIPLVTLSMNAAAQSGTAEGLRGGLRGEVLDPQGLPVPDATVVLTLGTGGLLETTSDDAGAFVFDGLPPGPHAATVIRAGFSVRTVDVVVDGGGEAAVSIPLEIAFAEDVTVVGQQQERTLQDTEASVVVTTGAQLEASTNTDLYRLVEVTPNVNSSFGNKGFSIRGIDQRGLGGGSGLLVSVKVDGATIQDNQGTFFGPYSTWDMGQVEIFRGPQSTQQGRNSLAGAIVLESADPVYEPLVKGRFSLGNLAANHTSGTVNVPLVDNKAALRVSFDQRRTDGWVTNPTRSQNDYDFRDSMNVRTKLRFDPTARFRGVMTLSYTDSRGGEDSIDVDRFRRTGERVNLSDEPAEEGSRHQVATVDLAYDLSGAFSLESTSSVYNHDYLRTEDFDQSPVPGGDLDYTTDDRWVTQEVGLRYAGSDRASGVVGLYYANLDDSQNALANGSGAILGLPGATVTGFFTVRERTENAALFGEFDLALANRWSLTLGARYDDESRETRNTQGIRVTPPTPFFPDRPAQEEVLDASYRAFLPKAALTRAWSPELSTTFSYQRGYRAGGRSIAFVSQQIGDFDPEFTHNYELALRARSADRRWQANTNVFYIDWRDQQVTALTDYGHEFDTITVNAGESTLYGFEAQTEYWLIQNLSLYGSVGLMRTRFDEFVDGDLDLAGNQFPYAPNWSFVAGTSWRVDEWVGDLHLAAQDDAFSERENDPRFHVGGRKLLNTRFGYQRERWGLFFFGRNLLGEAYLMQAWEATGAGYLIGGRSGEPRTYGLELTVGI